MAGFVVGYFAGLSQQSRSSRQLCRRHRRRRRRRRRFGLTFIRVTSHNLFLGVHFISNCWAVRVWIRVAAPTPVTRCVDPALTLVEKGASSEMQSNSVLGMR